MVDLGPEKYFCVEPSRASGVTCRLEVETSEEVERLEED